MEWRNAQRHDAHMSPDLTDAELDPTMRGPIENAARRHAALAEKFEAARTRA
jgi:hypothetical protein